MMMTGAKAIVKMLEAEGVTTIFGYPGAGNAPLYDALLESNIKHILPRGEQAAAHEANGYARTSGKVGVCTATSGPGATNLITGIATAYMDSIPMVAITGQVPVHMIGQDAFQEVDIVGATEPITKHNYLVKNAADIPRIIKEAFYIAKTGRPGPVLIDVPMDVAKTEIDFKQPGAVEIRGYKPTIKGSPLQIKKFLAALATAKKPVIVAGGGIASAGAEAKMREFIQKTKIPVVTTLMGITSAPNYGDYWLGMIGLHGCLPANHAVGEADLLIAIGVRFNDRTVAKHKDREGLTVVHIDIDPAEIGKSIPAHIPIVGDVKTILGQILTELPEGNESAWTKELLALKKDPGYEQKEGYVNPKYAMKILSYLTQGNATVVTEVGQNQIWAANGYKASQKGAFITSGGFGTMGFGLPAAIGAKIGDPVRTVIAIEGDGSFQMSLAELATMRQWNVPLKIILFRNDWLGMVREYQKNNFGSRYHGVDISGSPDFVALSEVYGIRGERISSNAEVEAALSRMLADDESYFVEFVVDKDEPTL